MNKEYVLQKLNDNDKAHERLGEKIEVIKDAMNANHIELINAINFNRIDTEKLKTKYGLMGLGVSALTLIGDYIIRKY